MNILSNIKGFYSYYHTTAEFKQANPHVCTVKLSMCTRLDFAQASLEASAFLVGNIAFTIFYGLATAVTLNKISSHKVDLYQNVKEGIVHAGSIPVSLLGIISPQIINQKFLNLTGRESLIPAGDMGRIAVIQGDIVLRKREKI